MGRFAPRASDRGALGALAPQQIQRLKGFLFRTTRRLAQAERLPAAWTRAFLQDVHEEIFASVAPMVGGRLRREEVLHDRLLVPPWQHVPEFVDGLAGFAGELIVSARQEGDPEKKLLSVFTRAAEFHARCVNVQPFVDGNKRWARAMLVALLVDCGYFPGAVISDTDRDHYLKAVEKSVKLGNHEQLTSLILRGYIKLREMYDASVNPRV